MSSTTLGLLNSAAGQTLFNASTGAFSGFNNILKRYYEGPLRDLINSTRILAHVINQDVAGIDVMGEMVTLGLRTGRNVGFKYSREYAPIVAPGQQGTRQARWRTRSNYGTASFTGQGVAAARSSPGAFINLMDLEINGIAEDAQHGEQRTYYSDGSGALARIAAKAVAGAVSVLTLDFPGGIASQALGTQYIENGMRICILKTAEEADAVGATAAGDWVRDNAGTVSSFTITAVDYSAGTITLSHNIDNEAAALQYIYVAQRGSIPIAEFQDAHSNRGMEMNGLSSIISDANPRLQRPATDPEPFQGFGNIDTAVENNWKAYVLSNGGIPVPWQSSFFDDALNGLAQAGNGVVKMWLTTFGIRSQFAGELISQRRYPDTLDLGGGYRAVSWNGIPLIVDKDCIRGTVFGLDTSTLGLAKMSDWEFVDNHGLVMDRIPGFDAFIVTLRRYAEFVCNARNRNCVIKDIIDV